MILKVLKIKFYLGLACLLLVNCTSDSDELETDTTGNENTSDEQVVINEKPDTTEEILTPSDDSSTIDQNNNDQPQNEETINDQPNEDSELSDEPRVLTEAETQQLNFAVTSIFDKTSSSPNSNAKKWNTAVNLFLSGDFDDSVVDFINNFSVELANISSNIDLNIVSSIGDSNVEMYFATREDYINDRPNFIQNYTPSGNAVGRANTSFRIPSFLINGRKIWADPSSRNFDSVIKHEILHILGFDHTDSPDSILFPTPSNDPNLSNDDVFTISTLYNNLINASFIESEIINTVEDNIEEFFE